MLALLAICTLVFLSSFGFGSLLLHVTLTDRMMANLSRSGTGILVGSALAIIIPEGAEMVYGLSKEHNSASLDGAATFEGLAGVAIILGFSIMFAIDQALELLGAEPVATYIAVDSLHTLSHESAGPISHNTRSSGQNANAATIGLCIHSLADGIAIGAASHASSSSSFIVFLAIILHKGPAAFALVSLLLSRSLSRKTIQYHLLAFSSAAPIGALLTYAMVWKTASGTHVDTATQITGLFLLLSGGTFLYVAVSHWPHNRITLSECCWLLAGLLFPVVIIMLTGHSH